MGRRCILHAKIQNLTTEASFALIWCLFSLLSLTMTLANLSISGPTSLPIAHLVSSHSDGPLRRKRSGGDTCIGRYLLNKLHALVGVERTNVTSPFGASPQHSEAQDPSGPGPKWPPGQRDPGDAKKRCMGDQVSMVAMWVAHLQMIQRRATTWGWML